MEPKGDAPNWSEDLRMVLRHLWDPDRLSQSPLADLAVVRQRAARYDESLPAPLDRAQALRQVLTEALESLRPPGPPQPRDRRWQRYRLLHDTYWQGQDNEAVMRRLYLSRTTFYREQRQAIAALAQALADLSTPAPVPSSSSTSYEAIPTVRDFVGRAAELTHYETLLDERGWAVIEGAPGVGKTALGAALAHRRAARERVFWYTFRPDLNDDAPAVVQALALFLAQPGDADLTTVSLDAQPLGLTVARLLAGLHRRPTLLCFDDAHVADDDPAVRSLLQSLLQSANERRLTLLVLSRHRPAFTSEPAGPALSGLSEADAATLLEHMGLPPLPPDLFAALYERTQGYPQLLRLFAAGIRDREPSSAPVEQCRRAVAVLPRQRAVHAYLLNNVLHTLSPQEQEALQTLAVCRPPVPYAVAEALLTGLGGDVRAILYALVDHHVLEETAEGTALLLAPLVRDFCYDLLAGRETVRRRLHQRAAAAYEAEGEVLEAVYQYVAAGELGPAVGLLVAHADTLLEAGQAGLLARQLAGFPAEPGAHLSLADWVAVRIILGRTQTQLGDYDGAIATYDLLLAALRPIEDAQARRWRAQAYYWLSSTYEQQGDYPAALNSLQQGIAQADEPGWRGRLLARMAGVFYRQGQYDQAWACCEHGLAVLPPEGQDDVVGEIYRLLGTIHHSRGDLTQAIAYAETALWAGRRASDVAGQIRAHQDLANYYAQRGDLTAGEHAMQIQLLRGHTARPGRNLTRAAEPLPDGEVQL